MSAFQALGIFLLVFLGTSLLFKLPMAFSMGLTCVAMIVFVGQPSLSLAQTSFASLDSFPFLAIPFFVFAGALMQYSGISTSLVNFIQAFVGRLRGSLGALLVLTSMAFGVLTGSTVATLSSIGKMMVPELVKHGYKKSYASALAAASGFLGILIPPSVPGIFYALAAGQNIAEVWIATAGPAIFIGLGYIIVNFLIHGRNEAKATEPLIFKSFTKNIVKQTKNALPALLMPIIIFGGIYGGAFTPTEAGAVCGFSYFSNISLGVYPLFSQIRVLLVRSMTSCITSLTCFSLLKSTPLVLSTSNIPCTEKSNWHIPWTSS
jgi:C4-dicarboxylate transporter DctM subunit